MDLQSIVQALRGAGGGGGMAAQGAPQQGAGMGGGATPQGGGNPMASGAIALSPAYQQYREQAMLNGEPPMPPEQWAAMQGQGQ